ncbi:DegT/DnrJ/EryC1/StrS family aminotransferase [Lentzea aerocolonigenes]|uniref:DegT/DnrJ/EryC1/StrS family aminotransferase n=1 Tax=Lentzea aerocolonigenes TaxID=68170 RepID=UPI000B31FF64
MPFCAYRHVAIGCAEYLKVRHTVAMSSCTGALHVGLAALGIGAGDEEHPC